MSDDGLDGGAAAQLLLDDTEDAALLAGNEDPTRILRVVAAVSLVDIGPLDRTACECLSAINDVPQGVTIILVIRQRLKRSDTSSLLAPNPIADRLAFSKCSFSLIHQRLG